MKTSHVSARLCAFILCAYSFFTNALPAQAIRVANNSLDPFNGWLRRTVLPLPSTPEAGVLPDGTTYILGRRIGLIGRVVDLHLHLLPGQKRTEDLSLAVSMPTPTPVLHGDPATFYGIPSIAGQPLSIVSVAVDGAAVSVHLRGRPSAGLLAEVWALIYPGQLFAIGELMLAASDPRLPGLTAAVPADLRLRVGATIVLVPALQPGSAFLAAGETVGDGQCRAWPIAIVWPGGDAASAAALIDGSVCGFGVLRPAPTGQWAEVPARFDADSWIRQELPGALARLHSWDAGPLGVTAGSGVSGAQEDQGYVKGSEVAAGVAGAEYVRYLVGLGQLRRPCHLLEADGSLLRLGDHPRLVVWSGRPDARIGTDLLGKTAPLDGDRDAHGWYGPDREHWLINTLAAGYELTGSYALQWELQAEGRLFMLQETIDPALSTSHGDAARAKGWTMLVAALLHDLLEDRVLAAQIDQRARDRIERIYAPELQGKAAWDVRSDPRWLQDVGAGYVAAEAVYQQAVGCWGLAIASIKLGSPIGWQLACAGARGVCDIAYSQVSGTWTEWDEVGFHADGTMAADLAEGAGAHRTGWFRYAWFPMATSLASAIGYPRGAANHAQILGEARGLANAPMDWWPR